MKIYKHILFIPKIDSVIGNFLCGLSFNIYKEESEILRCEENSNWINNDYLNIIFGIINILQIIFITISYCLVYNSIEFI